MVLIPEKICLIGPTQDKMAVFGHILTKFGQIWPNMGKNGHFVLSGVNKTAFFLELSPVWTKKLSCKIILAQNCN